MDPNMLELLRRLGLVTAEQAAGLADLPNLTDADLDEIEVQLRDRFDHLRAGEVDTESVDNMRVLAAAVTAVRAERTGRPDVASQVAALDARMAEVPRPARRPSLGQLSRRSFRGLPAAGLTRTATPAGRELSSRQEVAEAMVAAIEASASGRPPGRVPVAVSRADYGEERSLGLDPHENARRIAAVNSPEALTAGGGTCAPTAVRYELLAVSSAERPVRDSALAVFGAERGGVRFLPPPKLVDAAGAIGVWSEATDANPGAATKPILIVEGGQEQEVRTGAITNRLGFGQFCARADPESVAAWLDLAAAAHARKAERELLSAIRAGSTAVTTARLLGAARDLLAAVDLATAGLRDRHRMADGAPLRTIFPSWARALMRADLARQLAGDATIAVTDAELDRHFAVRSVNVTWSLDLNPLGAQAAGALAGFPAAVEWFLFPEGSWLFLDGGELNVGVVRDAELVSRNSYEWFSETFEAAAHVGVESLAVTSTVCPDGSVAATRATTALCA